MANSLNEFTFPNPTAESASDEGKAGGTAEVARSAAGLVRTVIQVGDSRSLRLYHTLYLAMVLLLCLPLWFTKYPPLVDYPNHLARAYVSYHYNDVAAYRADYVKLAEPIPNMAIDLIVPPLLRFCDVRIAGKTFLTMTVLLFCFGCYSLGRAIHGGPTWLAFCFAFLSYNSLFLWGFVNYMFGVGMFLLTFAAWLKRRNSWNWSGLLLVTMLTFASYLAHLSAYTFLAAGFAVVLLYDYLALRRLTGRMLAGFLPLFPPLIAFFMFMGGSGHSGKIYWSTVFGKLVNAVAWMVEYNYRLELLSALLVAGVAALFSRRLKNLRLAWPILTTGVLFIALYLICPWAIFTSFSADVRFLPPAAVLILLAPKFEIDRRLGQIALVVLLLCALVRVGSVWSEWNKLDRTTEEEVRMFNLFEEGAKVYPITFLAPGMEENKAERPIHHNIHYATIYRHTLSPTFFALKGQQPVLFRNEPRFVKITAKTPFDSDIWKEIFANYDYLWCYKLNDQYVQFLSERSRLVGESGDIKIFRIERDKDKPSS